MLVTTTNHRAVAASDVGKNGASRLRQLGTRCESYDALARSTSTMLEFLGNHALHSHKHHLLDYSLISRLENDKMESTSVTEKVE